MYETLQCIHTSFMTAVLPYMHVCTMFSHTSITTATGSWLSLVMLVVGVVMIVVSLVLFVAVLFVAMGFQMRLQDSEYSQYFLYRVMYNYFNVIDTCDSAWQGTRNNLIIAAFVFSLFALLSLAAAAVALVFSSKYCRGVYISLLTSIACMCTNLLW